MNSISNLSHQDTSKVSIIIPVYNTEKFLRKCLDSVLQQTYKNLQIICVNDCSPDNSLSLLQEYASRDPRILIVNNKENLGLFHARIEGFKKAEGEYVCFLDSDDFISLDWIRLLVKKAETENADMVIANTVSVDANGSKYIYNNCMSWTFNRPSVVGIAPFELFMKDQGLNYSWHTVWNKLYKRTLFDRCCADYQKIVGHLIMTEDIAFSVGLFFYCQKLAFSNHDAYFYYRHNDASTSTTISKERIVKNLTDVVRVFHFFKAFLQNHNIYERYKHDFEEYRARSFRIWCNVIKERGLDRNKTITDGFLRGMEQNQFACTLPDDFYFYNIKTPWDDRYEKLKSTAIDSQIKLVSFDIFDTLITRPFRNPQDMFVYLGIKHASFFMENHVECFEKKRMEAEAFCRSEHSLFAHEQDCNLDEVYECFASLFGLPINIARQIQQFEEDLEVDLCQRRESICDIIELAKISDKKIIFTSDIYHNEGLIKTILSTRGLSLYDDLILSSRYRKLKSTGALFDVLIQKGAEYGVSPKEILHVGDNWESDIIMAQNKGLKTYFIPKTIDIMDSVHKDYYAGRMSIPSIDSGDTQINVRALLSQLPISTAETIVANELFDMPFIAWNRELRYNANFYLMGYYMLGMEMLGVAESIDRISRQNQYDKIIFLARDGFLAKRIFDMFESAKSGDTNPIPSAYFYVSRQSVLTLLICDCQSIKPIRDYVMITRHSPKTILSYVDDYIDDKDKLICDLSKEHICYADCFESERQFAKFCSVADQHVNFKRLQDDNETVKTTIKHIFMGNVATFDIGYSGRIQAALCQIVGKPIDVFFVHSNGQEAYKNADRWGFKIHEFLDYTPKVSSIIREYFFSELAPSCAGYDVVDGSLRPVFRKQEISNVEHYIINEIHRAAENFARKYCDTFHDNFMFQPRFCEMAFPFEMFLHDIPEKDMWCFNRCMVEDTMYSNLTESTLLSAWTSHKEYFGAQHFYDREYSKNIITTEEFRALSKFKKAMILFWTNRALFWEKVKNNLSKSKHSTK